MCQACEKQVRLFKVSEKRPVTSEQVLLLACSPNEVAMLELRTGVLGVWLDHREMW